MKKKAPKLHHQVKIINGEVYYKPFSEEAKKRAELFQGKNNKLVHFKPVGEMDERSVRQLNTYWQACKFASDRVDDPRWVTQKSVDFQVRMGLKFFDYDYIFYDEVTKQVHFKLMSISFDNLPHIHACNYFQNAYEIIANKIPYEGIYTVEMLIEDVKKSCKGVR